MSDEVMTAASYRKTVPFPKLEKMQGCPVLKITESGGPFDRFTLIDETHAPTVVPQKPVRIAGNFLDYMNDMYLLPDQVDLQAIDYGLYRSARDAENIQNYFLQALSQMSPK